MLKVAFISRLASIAPVIEHLSVRRCDCTLRHYRDPVCHPVIFFIIIATIRSIHKDRFLRACSAIIGEADRIRKLSWYGMDQNISRHVFTRDGDLSRIAVERILAGIQDLPADGHIGIALMTRHHRLIWQFKALIWNQSCFVVLSFFHSPGSILDGRTLHRDQNGICILQLLPLCIDGRLRSDAAAEVELPGIRTRPVGPSCKDIRRILRLRILRLAYFVLLHWPCVITQHIVRLRIICKDLSVGVKRHMIKGSLFIQRRSSSIHDHVVIHIFTADIKLIDSRLHTIANVISAIAAGSLCFKCIHGITVAVPEFHRASVRLSIHRDQLMCFAILPPYSVQRHIRFHCITAKVPSMRILSLPMIKIVQPVRLIYLWIGRFLNFAARRNLLLCRRLRLIAVPLQIKADRISLCIVSRSLIASCILCHSLHRQQRKAKSEHKDHAE